MKKYQKVMVTGVTGFLGSHLTLQLLNKGYKVHGTARDLEKARDFKEILSKFTMNIENLEIREADLKEPGDWNDIMKDIEAVFHVASPFPQELPKDPDDLYIPAVEGTLNVLKAANRNGVKRVILTSSSGAVTYGRSRDDFKTVYNEKDWTDPHNQKDTTYYFNSKTLAERAAWDFMEKNGNGMKLTTICPGAILGPVLNGGMSASINIVKKTMEASAPMVPNMGYDMVDVRDVARLHILALENDESAGQRFIASSGYLFFRDVSNILKKAYPDRKIPTRVAPNLLLKILSRFDGTIEPLLIDLGKVRKLDHSKAEDILHWKPRPPEDAVLATAESLLQKEMVT
jgi:dihydroflavonol-4-reductase